MIDKLICVKTEKLAWIAVIGLIGLLYIKWMGFKVAAGGLVVSHCETFPPSSMCYTIMPVRGGFNITPITPIWLLGVTGVIVYF